jgi:antitoxin component of MazEF toxin-antitoxin module
MNTNIIQIGNSNGVIIPADMLRMLQLKTKSAVNVSMEGNPMPGNLTDGVCMFLYL